MQVALVASQKENCGLVCARGRARREGVLEQRKSLGPQRRPSSSETELKRRRSQAHSTPGAGIPRKGPLRTASASCTLAHGERKLGQLGWPARTGSSRTRQASLEAPRSLLASEMCPHAITARAPPRAHLSPGARAPSSPRASPGPGAAAAAGGAAWPRVARATRRAPAAARPRMSGRLGANALRCNVAAAPHPNVHVQQRAQLRRVAGKRRGQRRSRPA